VHRSNLHAKRANEVQLSPQSKTTRFFGNGKLGKQDVVGFVELSSTVGNMLQMEVMDAWKSDFKLKTPKAMLPGF
jgi:hypothetical protein